MAGKAASTSSSRPKTATNAAGSQRSFFVFAALAGSLTLTGLGLKLLSPPPVNASDRLFSTEPIEHVAPKVTVTKDWRSIYIRQSKSRPSDLAVLSDDELTDHFLISATSGGDCEVRISPRWKSQAPALPPRGAKSLPTDCISICLVGDFDRFQPGYAQMQRLAELVNSLQAKHRISGNGVFWMKVDESPVGIGKRFPADEFRKRVLP